MIGYAKKFISDSPWSDEAMIEVHQSLVAQTLNFGVCKTFEKPACFIEKDRFDKKCHILQGIV